MEIELVLNNGLINPWNIYSPTIYVFSNLVQTSLLCLKLLNKHFFMLLALGENNVVVRGGFRSIFVEIYLRSVP